MNVTTEIDDGDEPTAMVMVMIRESDGTGHNAAVQLHDSLITPPRLAEAVVSAVHGAARTHSVGSPTSFSGRSAHGGERSTRASRTRSS